MAMKTKLLIGLFISMAFISKAQNYFGNDACWTEFWVNPNTEITEGKSQYYLSGDTILNNKTYRKVIGRSPNNLAQPTYYIGAIREESGKVFKQYTDYETMVMGEFLLYDFTVKVGDTIRSTSPSGELSRKPVVTKIDTIELLTGEKRKRFSFNGASEWIEGIGSINGFFTPSEELAIGYSIPYLVCYKQGGIEYYKNNNLCPDGTCCDAITGLENPKQVDQISFLSPNPTNRFIQFNFSENIEQYKSIKLFDSLGNLLQNFTKTNNNLALDLSNYSSGLYFVVIEFDKNYELHKIIKL